jgi:hypothetical protein
MSALAICHQPRIAPDDMGASQYQPSVTPELSALTIIHVQSDGRSVALIGPENGRWFWGARQSAAAIVTW